MNQKKVFILIFVLLMPLLQTIDVSDVSSSIIYNELPPNMDPTWKTYFENADFDGDGVLYPYDQYLGRDDASIDFFTKQGGTLRTWDSETYIWDPIDATNSTSVTRVSKIFEGLIQYVPGTVDIMPCLASAWEISSDGKTYTFYIREGVTFTNGEPLTAEDVEFSWDRLENPVYNSPRRNYLTNFVESYEVVNDYVFRVTLKNPFSPFLSLASVGWFSILPKDYVSSNEVVYEDRVEKYWLDNPIGTGPWKLKEFISGSHMILEANTDYWAGRPYLDEYKITFSTQVWKNEEMDITPLPQQYWGEFEVLYPENIVRSVYYLATYWMYFNCSDWPFDNKAVRQAVTCGIERENTIKDLYRGKYLPAHGPLPPDMPGFSQELYDNYEWTYNPSKAREILDNAGIIDTDNDGIRELDGMPLVFELSSYMPTIWGDTAEVWIQNLAEIGIDMKYEQYDFWILLDKVYDADYTMLTIGWIADYPDSENYFMLFETKNIPSPNHCRYSNPVVDDLIQQLRMAVDTEEREHIAYQIEAILQEDCPMLWYFHSSNIKAVQEWVHDYIYGPLWEHAEKHIGCWISPNTVALEAVPQCATADGASTLTITATLCDKEGNPVADGTMVNFTTTAGTLSGITTTTNGIASATLTSPSIAETATVKAFANGAVNDHATVFFTTMLTDVEAVVEEEVTDATMDATDEADTTVEVEGTATVTVAKYYDNPGAGFTGDAIEKYIDVYVPDASDSTKIEIRLYYSDSDVIDVDESTLALHWWNGTEWIECSNSGVNVDENYIWAIIDTTTTPTLNELQGTAFTAGIRLFNGYETIEYIKDNVENKGIVTSLATSIELAMKHIENDRYNVAINVLDAFINKIEAQEGKNIPQNIADNLIRWTEIWKENPESMIF